MANAGRAITIEHGRAIGVLNLPQRRYGKVLHCDRSRAIIYDIKDRAEGSLGRTIDDDLITLSNPKNVRFSELMKICERYFGPPRTKGSHNIFKTPWYGDPRINIQNDGKMAKPYQVRIVVRALEKLLED